MAAETDRDVENLLRSALRPIEPPENLAGRVEETLSAVTEAAAEELSAWAEELSESELRSLRDPPIKRYGNGLVLSDSFRIAAKPRRRRACRSRRLSLRARAQRSSAPAFSR